MLRRARTNIARLTAAAAVTTLALSLGAVAHADPKQSLAKVKHDIASERHQLSELQDKAEAAAERYNTGVLELAKAKRVADDKRAAAATAARKVTEMRAQLSVFALQLYKGGDPAAVALLDQAQDPQTFIDRAAYSDQLSQQKAATLAAVDTAEHDAAVAAQAAKQAVAAQQAVVRQLAAAKHEVDQAATQAQHILADLRHKQQQLIHEIQVEAARAAAARRAAARRAEARARAEAQRLAEQQAATRAAQHHIDSQPSDPAPAPAPAPAPPSSGNAASIAVSWAHQELGKPYVWAAAGPDSFDCSGLTMYVYAKAGIYLPHSAAAQYGYGTHVSRSQLAPGDLVFFGGPIHHVGIYIGGGEMIEAPHTGADVRISGVDRPDYAGATRLG